MASAGNENSVTMIRDLSQEKRIMLWQSASQRANRCKWLYVTTGSLALLSSGTTTTVLAGLIEKPGMQVVAAALAFASGILSLLMTAIYDAKDTNRMYDGASRYAQLREKAQTLLDQLASLSDNRCREMLKDLRSESARLSGEFDRLLSSRSVNILKEGPFGGAAAVDSE